MWLISNKVYTVRCQIIQKKSFADIKYICSYFEACNYLIHLVDFGILSQRAVICFISFMWILELTMKTWLNNETAFFVKSFQLWFMSPTFEEQIQMHCY